MDLTPKGYKRDPSSKSKKDKEEVVDENLLDELDEDDNEEWNAETVNKYLDRFEDKKYKKFGESDPDLGDLQKDFDWESLATKEELEVFT